MRVPGPTYGKLNIQLRNYSENISSDENVTMGVVYLQHLFEIFITSSYVMEISNKFTCDIIQS
jgi:hypothetical protein